MQRRATSLVGTPSAASKSALAWTTLRREATLSGDVLESSSLLVGHGQRLRGDRRHRGILATIVISQTHH